jgi:hypothetical protein
MGHLHHSNMLVYCFPNPNIKLAMWYYLIWGTSWNGGTRTPKVMPKNGHFGITHGDLGLPHRKTPSETAAWASGQSQARSPNRQVAGDHDDAQLSPLVDVLEAPRCTKSSRGLWGTMEKVRSDFYKKYDVLKLSGWKFRTVPSICFTLLFHASS